MDWISVEKQLPLEGLEVLVWIVPTEQNCWSEEYDADDPYKHGTWEKGHWDGTLWKGGAFLEDGIESPFVRVSHWYDVSCPSREEE